MLTQSWKPRSWIHAGAIAGGMILAAGGCSHRYCEPAPGPQCLPACCGAPPLCFGFHSTSWRPWPEECLIDPSYGAFEQIDMLPIEEMPEPEQHLEIPTAPPLIGR